MNKRTLMILFVTAVLLLTSISPGVAQNPQPEFTDEINKISLASGAPWVTQHVDGADGNSAGTHASVVYSPGGVPYISYYNIENGELWYARPVSSGGNCGESNSWLCEMVDTDGDVGRYSSIDYWKSSDGIARWKLGISYYDSTNRAIKLAIYSCILGFSCEWKTYTIQQATNVNQDYGRYSSFKFTLDGGPVIAYHYSYSLSTDALKYAYEMDGGNCGLGDVLGKWQCDSVNVGEGMGKFPSLSVTWDGVVYIAYYDEGNGNLKYAYYQPLGGNCGPADSWICTVIDGNGGSDVGLFASFATPQFSGDKFRIAYHDKTNGALKIAYTLSGGNCDAPGWQCDVVDDTLTSIEPMGISLATDETGIPIIAYQQFDSDFSPSELKIARPASSLGVNVGNCGDVPPGYLFFYWQCDTLDSGDAYTGVANYTSVAVDPNGLAIIAYPESNDYDYYDTLRVAYQIYNKLYLPLVVRAP